MKLRLPGLMLTLALQAAPALSDELPGSPQPLASFIEISGTATTLLRIAIPNDATLRVRFIDRSRKHRPLTLAEQNYDLAGAQLPISFSATLDRDLIGARAKLAVAAQVAQRGLPLLAGEAPFSADGLHPVEVMLRPAGSSPARR